MMFRIVDSNVIDNGIMSNFRHLGQSGIDFSDIYSIDVNYHEDIIKKLFERDIDYISSLNRKNKLNKFKKNDKINISNLFIDFYLKNIDYVYLIKIDE